MKLSGKFKEKLGFTLAEVMIVVAILAILTAVAAPNVAKYARSIRLRELNDSARAIYMAAEHKFTADVNKGVKLSESLELKSDDGLEPVATTRYIFDTTDTSKIPAEMGYVINRSGDNNKLVNIVESELEENNYIVEFNPETGDVYGVFYSNETDFTEEDYENNYNKEGSNFDNAVHDGLKNDKLIGFYGNETIKPDEIEKREISKPSVKVINKEKLVVEITNNGDKDEHLEVKVDGMGDIVPRSSNAYIPAGKYVIIILDSLDGNTDFTLSGPLPDATVIYEKPMTLTDCEDVNLTVTFYDEEGKSRDQTVTKTFNPLFADGSSNSTVYVDYGRHLQNLEKANPTDVIIRRTIDFDNGAGSYEGWQGTYGDKKFKALKLQDKTGLTISAPSGAEIQNIDIEGVDVYGDGKIYSGLFTLFYGTAKHLVFRNPTISGGTISGALAGMSLSCPKIYDIKVINPTIYGEYEAGGLIGSDANSVIENCAVYIECDSGSWNDPTSDPYSSHTIVSDNSILSTAGGIIGSTMGTTVKNSYAAVKIKGGSAGGLIGACIEVGGTQTTIENSFSAGHTFYGIYKGTAKNGTAVNLTDNVSGIDAGGLVSSSQGDLILKGTVFSSCSVSGNKVDPLYNISESGGVEQKAAFAPDTDTVYTLGTAYKTDGATVTEIKKSADTNVKTADQVMYTNEADFTVGKRYDMKVSSVFKYPVPGGMIMHGDWCNTEDITGFIYWEKEGTDYRIQALWYGKGKPEELKIPAEKQLCKEQDGNNISEYGYAAFTIGGSLDNLVEFKDASGNNLDDVIKPSEDTSAASIVDGIRKILKESDELKDKISKDEDIKINIYSGIVVGKGLVTATVSGHEYTFAPDFYAIYADQDANHAGTPKDEYGIRTEQQLRNISALENISNLDKNYKQSHDIDVKGKDELTPIGDKDNPFTGTYDGGSYRIIGAKFAANSDKSVGLFGTASGATLENIVLFNPAESADDFIALGGKKIDEPTSSSLDETLPAVDGEPAPDYASAPYDETLAAVDGGATVAFNETVKVGSKYESTYGYVLLEGKSAQNFLKAYIDNIGNDNFAVMINPEPDSSCRLTFVSNSISNPTKSFGVPCSYNINENNVFNLDEYVKSVVPENAVDLKIYIYSSSAKFASGKPVTITIGPKANHKHELGDVLKYNQSSDYHVRKCTVSGCNYEEHEAHTIVWKPTEDKQAHRGYCEVCDYYITHWEAHTYVGSKCSKCGETTEHNYVLKSDASGHWYECDKLHGCSGSEIGRASHVFSGGYTITADKHTATCDVCGYKVDEAHDRGKVTNNGDGTHKIECSKCGQLIIANENHEWVYKSCTDSKHDYECNVCKAVKSEPHTGDITKWESDDVAHFHICDTCNQKYGTITHRYGDTAMDDGNGKTHTRTCTVCGYQIKVNHVMGDWKEYDSDQHVRECTYCGYKEYADHNYGTTGKAERCHDCGKHNPDGVQYDGVEAHNIGGIVAVADNTTISNCVVSGYLIDGLESSGGIAGVFDGTLSNSHAVVTFSAVKNYVGGLVGKSTGAVGSIKNSYAIVHSYKGENDYNVGGILGSGEIPVTDCYSMFKNLPIKGSAISNNSASSSNYYVNSTGFCPSARHTEGAVGVSYEKFKETLATNLGDTADKTYTNNAKEYAAKGAENAYIYTAFTTDKTDGNKPVHFGPVPEKVSTIDDLVRGPVAGIFDVNTYKYGTNESGQFDGYLVYNRSGTINQYEAWEPEKDGNHAEKGGEYVGVFFCNPKFFAPKGEGDNGDDLSEFKEDMVIKYNDDIGKVIFDERIQVLVNGIEIPHERLKPFDDYLSQKGISIDQYGARSGYYHFKSEPDMVTDQFFAGHQPGTSINDAFRLFVILEKVGSNEILKKEDIESIQIKFTPKDGEQGTLIKADNPKDGSNSRMQAELPPSSAESLVEEPKVIVFMASPDRIHDESMPKYVNTYFMLARASRTDISYGTLGSGTGTEGYLGIMVPKEYIGYLESQTLLFNVCGAPSRLERWGEGEEGPKQADISNLESVAEKTGIDLNEYEIYYVTNITKSARDDALNSGLHSFSVQFGTREIFRSSFDDFKKNINATDYKFMPKIGVGALYYKPGKSDDTSVGYNAQGYFANMIDIGGVNGTEKSLEGFSSWIYQMGGANGEMSSMIQLSDSLLLFAEKGSDGSQMDLNSVTVLVNGTVVDVDTPIAIVNYIDKAGSDYTRGSGSKLTQKYDCDVYKLKLPNDKINPEDEILVKYKDQLIINCHYKDFAVGANPKKSVMPKMALVSLYENTDSKIYAQGFVAENANAPYPVNVEDLPKKQQIYALLLTGGTTGFRVTVDDQPAQISMTPIPFENSGTFGISDYYAIIPSAPFTDSSEIKVYYFDEIVMTKLGSDFDPGLVEAPNEVKSQIGLGTINEYWDNTANKKYVYGVANLGDGNKVAEKIGEAKSGILIVNKSYAEFNRELVKITIIDNSNNKVDLSLTEWTGEIDNAGNFEDYTIYTIENFNPWRPTKLYYDGKFVMNIN